MQSSPPRAMVVEDDQSWQSILTEILTDAGLAVDVAGNLPAAAACLRGAPHRLAVVDLSLGGSDHRNQDGLAILDALRRHDPGCVAILLTGYATVELAVSALTEYGAFTCLRKESFRRRDFRAVVKQALNRAPGVVEDRGVRADSVARPVDHEASLAQHESGQQPAGEIPASTGPALVVEDDAGWRSILAELLADAGYEVRLASSYGEALGYLRREAYRLAVVDLALASSLALEDNSDGLRLLEMTRRAGIPAVVVSGSALPREIERAYEEHGIVAYLEKRAFDRRSFYHAVKLAEAETATRMAASGLDRLTEREYETLTLLSQGLTNKEIAQALVISENTVKRHLKSIFAKLGVSTRAAAAARAMSANRDSF